MDPNQPDLPPNMEWLTRNIDFNDQNHVQKEIELITASLNEQASTDRKRMAERIFVGLWLPVFYEGKNKFYPEVNFGMWANYAGSSYSEVDVINVTTGEVLFTVPPLLDRGGMRTLVGQARTSQRGGDLRNVIQNAELKSRVSPAMGKQFLEHHLAQRARAMSTIPPTVAVNIHRWNTIFTRYGLKPIVAEQENTAHSDSVTPALGQNNDEGDWELL